MLEQKDTKIRDINSVVAKGQRLAKAVYLVSSFVSDSDPLKWKLRERSLELLTDSRNLVRDNLSAEVLSETQTLGQNSPGHFNAFALEKITTHLDYLLVLLELASSSGYVSEMNFTLLRKEIFSLSDFIRSQSGLSVMQQFLTEPAESNQAVLVGDRVSIDRLSAPIFRPAAPSLKDKSNRLVTEKSSPISSPKNGLLPKALDKENRKKTILDFVKDRGWTSIKDIAGTIRDCSEKTVQRELSEMVATGLLKKQGERRWSRYMLT